MLAWGDGRFDLIGRADLDDSAITMSESPVRWKEMPCEDRSGHAPRPPAAFLRATWTYSTQFPPFDWHDPIPTPHRGHLAYHIEGRATSGFTLLAPLRPSFERRGRI